MALTGNADEIGREPPPRAQEREKIHDTETLTDRAYRELEELVVTLQIAPGTIVSEAQLSKQLGIGRTPIREALQRLARERLVVIMPRRGIVVSEINIQTQLRVLEVRRELERLLARTSARRATDAQRARLREIGDAMIKNAERGDHTGFLRHDREFNQMMLEAARNEFAVSAVALMHGLSRRFWFLHYRQRADMPLLARLHAVVADAVARADIDAAGRATDRLMDYLEGFTRGTLSDG